MVAGIHYAYIKKDRPGLTESRNVGVRLASGDIIFFFDDDTILSPDYIEEILKIYQGDAEGNIGGVGGIITNFRPLKFRDRMRRAFEILFLISGTHEGKVLPSGFCVNYGDTGVSIYEKVRVDFLAGCAMSFRQRVFRDMSFDSDRYLNYGLGEDKEFTYRVSKKYDLIVTPKAKLKHLESKQMRIDKVKEGRMFFANRYIFFIKNVKKGWHSWIFFAYAMFGYILARIISLVLLPKKKKFEKLKGIFGAIKDILKTNIVLVE